MAASDARPVPRKNTAYRVTFPILDADGDLVTGATGLDSEVSVDGGTFSDCTNEATEIATSSGIYYLDLTSGEMNGDTVAVIVKTTSSGAKTTTLIFYPEEVGDYRADVVQISGDSTAADNLEAALDGTGSVTITAAITGNITGNLSGTVGSVTGAVGSVTGAVGSVTGAVGSVTGNVGGNVVGSVASVTGAVGSVTGAVGSVTGNVGGNVTGSVGSVAAGGIAAASFAAGAIDATAIAADAIGSSELAATAANEIADAILARNIAGGSSTGRIVTDALRLLRNKVSISGGTMTVTQEDDSTSAWTAAITTTAGDPISAIDPA